MASIEGSGTPLAFSIADPPLAFRAPATTGRSLRTSVRALEGMQKEAVVSLAPDDRSWRLVSDEGPYLNGTDLAPFPLAFFAAGMQFSLLSEILQAARRRDVPLDGLSLRVDNRYTMEGSFLRGDAVGGAHPSELEVSVETSRPSAEVRQVVDEAVSRCPAQALMRDVTLNSFALAVNGDVADLPVLAGPPSTEVSYDESSFDGLEPGNDTADPAIEKLESAATLVGVEGGAGSSLQAEQKRTLHVRGEARWLHGMRTEAEIRLLKPIGSLFRFRCDETRSNGGAESAPPPLAYLTAGIGFCFMTQIGRYAHIVKQLLAGYGIVQDNRFASQAAQPTETHVFLSLEDAPEIGPDLVTVGERTCFLHAAMRTGLPSVLRVQVNGELLPSG